ncbi:GNAT family N-acetyltransferase [Noviherbaspirillum galbum]|uniref:GNAT family N-acetyltransferase n=1 Tax=Noviherbaspirillum galbum TaxID=2709383 RepID=A0A6B3SVR9_9BURK|nr:GNAT family N-acetyltransferase [Noviherbaspirillum galbum]NEX63485.1 GNAT family N-acetyltransferase [Noviherbaspirillum galbum]
MTQATSLERADGIRIAVVPQFDEPAFTETVERLFGDLARRSLLRSQLGDDAFARADALRDSLPAPERLRVGAFDGDTLVGWSMGWYERGGAFYVANSAVLPAHRRRGVYSRLARAVLDEAAARGCHTVYSRHLSTNNPVLIAKLRLGFVITGMEFSEELGSLVRMSFFLTPERARLHAERSGPVGGFDGRSG